LISSSESAERSAISVEKNVKATTLTSILDNSRLANQQIDFLNIDCEGHDLKVLQGPEFDRFRPSIIAIEAHTESEEGEITALLESKGYSLQSRVYVTLVFAVRTPAVADRLWEFNFSDKLEKLSETAQRGQKSQDCVTAIRSIPITDH
jgi:hypothetical protein